MGAGQRIAAGIGAAGAAAGGAVAPLNQDDNIDRNVAANEIPAYYQESPYEHKAPEQAAEQTASEQGFTISNPQEKPQPSTQQKVGELGEEMQNAAGAAADGQKLKNNAEETGEMDNALRGPEQGEYRDTKSEPKASDKEPSKGETAGQGESNDSGVSAAGNPSTDRSPGTDSGQSSGDGYDYYSGYGY